MRAREGRADRRRRGTSAGGKHHRRPDFVWWVAGDGAAEYTKTAGLQSTPILNERAFSSLLNEYGVEYPPERGGGAYPGAGYISPVVAIRRQCPGVGQGAVRGPLDRTTA